MTDDRTAEQIMCEGHYADLAFDAANLRDAYNAMGHVALFLASLDVGDEDRVQNALKELGEASDYVKVAAMNLEGRTPENDAQLVEVAEALKASRTS